MGLKSKDDQPQQPELLKCPRCNSNNTKFCYYNNYNKSQPRHFCKSCKRHWTQGGTLRNVPMGGARKNKRPRTTTTSNSSSTSNSVVASTPTTMATFPNAGSDNNETLSTVLYRALVCSDPCGTSTSINTTTAPGKPPKSLSGECDPITSIGDHENEMYLQPIIDHYPDMEPTMTPAGKSTVTWPNIDVMDIQSHCWNWEEIDEYAFGNSSDFNVAWDDLYSERKP